MDDRENDIRWENDMLGFSEALKALDKLVEAAKPKTRDQIAAEKQREEAALEAKYAKKRAEFDEMARMLSIAYESFLNNGFSEEQSFTLLTGMINSCTVGGKK